MHTISSDLAGSVVQHSVNNMAVIPKTQRYNSCIESYSNPIYYLKPCGTAALHVVVSRCYPLTSVLLTTPFATSPAVSQHNSACENKRDHVGELTLRTLSVTTVVR